MCACVVLCQLDEKRSVFQSVLTAFGIALCAEEVSSETDSPSLRSLHAHLTSRLATLCRHSDRFVPQLISADSSRCVGMCDDDACTPTPTVCRALDHTRACVDNRCRDGTLRAILDKVALDITNAVGAERQEVQGRLRAIAGDPFL